MCAKMRFCAIMPFAVTRFYFPSLPLCDCKECKVLLTLNPSNHFPMCNSPRSQLCAWLNVSPLLVAFGLFVVWYDKAFDKAGPSYQHPPANVPWHQTLHAFNKHPYIFKKPGVSNTKSADENNPHAALDSGIFHVFHFNRSVTIFLLNRKYFYVTKIC